MRFEKLDQNSVSSYLTSRMFSLLPILLQASYRLIRTHNRNLAHQQHQLPMLQKHIFRLITFFACYFFALSLCLSSCLLLIDMKKKSIRRIKEPADEGRGRESGAERRRWKYFVKSEKGRKTLKKCRIDRYFSLLCINPRNNKRGENTFLPFTIVRINECHHIRTENVLWWAL